VRLASHGDLKGLIILITAEFAPGHRNPLPLMAETIGSLIACEPPGQGQT
jgi:hypothetical protein